MFAVTRVATCSNVCNRTAESYYCWVERNKTRDVFIALARRDHRKSKFGLRHSIKLIELYCMTKSEFWFSIAWLRTSDGHVPKPDLGEGKLSNPRARAVLQIDSVLFNKSTVLMKFCKRHASARSWCITHGHGVMHDWVWVLDLHVCVTKFNQRLNRLSILLTWPIGNWRITPARGTRGIP